MANLVMGAMQSIIPKLYRLLKEEYNLQAGMKERINSLTQELELAQAALCKVAEVPWDQLDKHVQIWARKVREASYDMEDVLDTFLVRVEGPESTEQKKNLLKHIKKMTNFFKKSKARRNISGDVKNIMTHLQEVTEQCRRYKVEDIGTRIEQCRRYKVEDIGTRTATTSSVDPRLHAMYTQVDKLVGIDKSSGELKSMLQLDDMSNTKMKAVSIVGIGGLGKTTLAKAVYDNLRGDFNCRAFVSVGRNPDLQNVLQMILIALDKERYKMFNFAVLHDITLFIDELRELLHGKRYLIVIDDLWEKQSWEVLRLAIAYDKSCEGRIIITTRKWEVANIADDVYQLPPLPNDSSRKLFYTRIYGDERANVDYQTDEVSDEILRKCAGIPLAIITMASLLVDEPRDRWREVYKCIGFGCKEEEAENTMKKILSFSYYDLPSHLRTCLLYLGAFSEDSIIPKVSLVWIWVAEGFVQKQKGKGLFEIGEGYYNDLINRSLIQEVDEEDYIHGCRVHDMVLDFVLSISSEENFFTVFDNNDQATLVPGNVVRRLADHNKTMVLSNQANMFDMSKVRSFISRLDNYTVDTWTLVSSLKLLRVLIIGENYSNDNLLQLEPLGQLLHLRFLGINGRRIEKIPKEIGALNMLQTLDLRSSLVREMPSYSSFPIQLLCLQIRIIFFDNSDTEKFLVGRLTSLETLSIFLFGPVKMTRYLVKELISLSELRELNATISLEDHEEIRRDLLESVRHLHKLQHLNIRSKLFFRQQEMEFVLPGGLRYLALHGLVLCKLPSCIDPLCHRKLSHLDLCLQYMDEQELKTLGGLPELRFLALTLLYSSPTIHNISDCDACYFPKLRCLRLRGSLAFFVAKKGGDGKNSVSFHIWDAKAEVPQIEGITMPPSVSDSELQGDDEFFDEELRLLSICDDVHPSRRSIQPSKLQHGIAMPPVSDEERHNGTISTWEGEGHGAATNRFMPSLQVLHFHVRDPTYCNNLGLEFLCSLQEISFSIDRGCEGDTEELKKEVEAALRSAAQVHPNHPLCIEKELRRNSWSRGSRSQDMNYESSKKMKRTNSVPL